MPRIFRQSVCRQAKRGPKWKRNGRATAFHSTVAKIDTCAGAVLSPAERASTRSLVASETQMEDSIPVQDLRSFLQLLEARGELATIRSSVSLNQEIGAVCLRNLRNSGPGLLFERAGDHDIRLAVDLLASRRRYAMALGAEADQLAAEWHRRTKNLIPPVMVENGLCQTPFWGGAHDAF